MISFMNRFSIHSKYIHNDVGVVEILSLLFSLWLSVFFFAYLDWKQLWKCTDEASCQHNFQSYIITNVSVFQVFT
jgi:hypothetical protein